MTAMNTNEPDNKNIKRTAILLALVAVTFYVAFIAVTALSR